jgi:hypothetical protein
MKVVNPDPFNLLKEQPVLLNHPVDARSPASVFNLSSLQAIELLFFFYLLVTIVFSGYYLYRTTLRIRRIDTPTHHWIGQLQPFSFE